MTKPKAQPKGDKIGVLVLVLLLLGAALTLFWRGDRALHESHVADQSSTGSSTGAAQLPPGLQGSIDNHMKGTYYQREFLRHDVASENELAESVGEPVYSPDDDVIPLRIKQENAAGKIVKQIERDQARINQQPATLEERIASKVARDEWVREYDEQYKEEFVKQFIENARQQGVDIRVNDNLDVTGLTTFEVEKPVRIPQSTPQSSK